MCCKIHCESIGIECFRLNRYALENYFSLKALKKVFKAQISKDIIELKPNEKLENQIHINVKNNSREIVREMSMEDIKSTDLYEFLLRIQDILKKS